MNFFDIHALINAQRKREVDSFDPNRAIIKCVTLAKDTTDSIAVSGRPGYIWVREYGVTGGVHQVLGVNVPDIVDLAVLAAYNPKTPYRKIVIGPDWSSIPEYSDYDGETFLADHSGDHEWPDFVPGFDVVSIYPRANVPLRAYPGTSGLTISVAPHRYIYNREFVEFDGSYDVDITAYKPSSGKAVRLLVYLDKISNSVSYVAGDAVIDAAANTPPSPVFPLNAKYSALVRLDGDQTVVAEADILDIRSVISDDDTHAASAEGQIMISNDGESLELGIPVTDINGDIVTNADGHIVVI